MYCCRKSKYCLTWEERMGVEHEIDNMVLDSMFSDAFFKRKLVLIEGQLETSSVPHRIRSNEKPSRKK